VLSLELIQRSTSASFNRPRSALSSLARDLQYPPTVDTAKWFRQRASTLQKVLSTTLLRLQDVIAQHLLLGPVKPRLLKEAATTARAHQHWLVTIDAFETYAREHGGDSAISADHLKQWGLRYLSGDDPEGRRESIYVADFADLAPAREAHRGTARASDRTAGWGGSERDRRREDGRRSTYRGDQQAARTDARDDRAGGGRGERQPWGSRARAADTRDDRDRVAPRDDSRRRRGGEAALDTNRGANGGASRDAAPAPANNNRRRY
jgi:hypothetical protein